MRYGRLGVAKEGVLKGCFVMLLVDFGVCRIGDKCGESGGVGRSYFNIGRGMREDVKSDFGREAISAQDNGFFDVAAGGVGNAIGVSGDTGAEGADESEIGGVSEVADATVRVGFSDFMCFVRTCSCSLILLLNFSGHCLQANASTFSFAMRAFSVCCCFFAIRIVSVWRCS